MLQSWWVLCDRFRKPGFIKTLLFICFCSFHSPQDEILHSALRRLSSSVINRKLFAIIYDRHIWKSTEGACLKFLKILSDFIFFRNVFLFFWSLFSKFYFDLWLSVNENTDKYFFLFLFKPRFRINRLFRPY